MGKLIGKLIEITGRGLITSKEFGGALVKRLGIAADPSTPAGRSKVAAFMRRHPKTAFLAQLVAYESGSTAVVALYEGIMNDPEYALLNAEFESSPEYQRAIVETSVARDKYLNSRGDGSADTVSGVTQDNWRANTLLIKEADERIERLIGVFGSLRTVEIAYMDLAALEPEHLESYRIRNA